MDLRMVTHPGNALSLILVSCASLIYAQNFTYLGARSLGLASASSTLSDEYSVFNNPGTLGFLNFESISAGYLSHNQVEGLHSAFSTFTKSVYKGNASLGVFRFGDDLYNKNQLTLGYGNKFGLAGLGISFSYHRYQIEGFGSRGFLSLNIGGLAEITPSLSFSGIIKNITQSKLSKHSGEYFPTVMSAGVSFRPSDQVTIVSQFDKDLGHKGLLKLGLEYSYSSLLFRTGLITDPALLSFGIGIRHKRFRIDYGIMTHQVLNASHSFSITYMIKE